MSDVYSDLNIKNGAKIVLGESGVSIDSSGCVVLDSGCTFELSDVATRCYVDEEISKICTDESVSGDYLQLNSTEKQNITSPVQFGGSVYLNNGGCGIIMSNCEAFVYSGATFRLPECTSGRYTLATTEDISGSGCSYPTCYPLYYSCCVVGAFCYDSIYNRVSLKTHSLDFCINTEYAGDIYIDSYRDVYIKAGSSISFMCENSDCAFCVFVPNRLPYMGGEIESTIVTSPGYTESGCGLQICVLTLCQYQNMQEHGMTTLYFIKPEN